MQGTDCRSLCRKQHGELAVQTSKYGSPSCSFAWLILTAFDSVALTSTVRCWSTKRQYVAYAAAMAGWPQPYQPLTMWFHRRWLPSACVSNQHT